MVADDSHDKMNKQQPSSGKAKYLFPQRWDQRSLWVNVRCELERTNDVHDATYRLPQSIQQPIDISSISLQITHISHYCNQQRIYCKKYPTTADQSIQKMFITYDVN